MDQSSGGQIMELLAANAANVRYFVRLVHIVGEPREISARGVSLALHNRLFHGVNFSTGKGRRQLVKLLVFTPKYTGFS